MELVKRELKLREGQQTIAFNKIVTEFVAAKDKNKNVNFVLTLPCNGGKTEVSIYSINELISMFPDIRVLVLAHSTNVLKHNFYNRMKSTNINFSVSTDLSDNSQVHITIPQNENKITQNYDLIVIDEAHHNYLGEQEQRIITKVNPTMNLLLTGTPSKLIRQGGFTFHIVGVTDIGLENYANVNMDLIATNGCDWKTSDYNADSQIRSNYEYSMDEIKTTMDTILERLLERVNYKLSASDFNQPTKWWSFKRKVKTSVNKIMSWEETYDKLGKTIIFCTNIAQADFVYEILKDKNVNVFISHSKNDLNSEKIFEFQESDNGVMVVVDRCREGYNDHKLENIIDLSGTRNPDLLHQMLMRVSRGNQTMDKFFVKVNSNNLIEMGVTELFMNVAINLLDTNFLKQYNGKNLNGLNIPIVVRTRRMGGEEVDEVVDEEVENTRTTNRSTNFRLPDFSVNLIKTFIDVKHDLNGLAQVYKTTTFGNAINNIRGKNTEIITDEKVLLSLGLTLEEYREYNKSKNI